MKSSIAVFIDYENAPIEKHANNLISFAKTRGIVITCKAYIRLWKKFPQQSKLLTDFGFSLVDVAFKLKNSADFKLMFDCLDLAKSQASPSIFILVTGDRDFVELITRLKSLGKQVIVFARTDSSSSRLKKLAHEFYPLEQLPQLLSNQSENASAT